MESLSFLVLMQEDLFESTEARLKAGFSDLTDPEEFFQVKAKVGIINEEVVLNEIQLFSIVKDRFGIKQGLNDISDLLTSDIKNALKIYIIENEL